MLVVTITRLTPRGERQKLAEAVIYNVRTDSNNLGNYEASFRLGGKRCGVSDYKGWPRKNKNVWRLLFLLLEGRGARP